MTEAIFGSQISIILPVIGVVECGNVIRAPVINDLINYSNNISVSMAGRPLHQKLEVLMYQWGNGKMPLGKHVHGHVFL